MKIAVISDNSSKEEWLAQGLASEMKIEWLQYPAAIPGVDCYIDLLFQPGKERVEKLQSLLPALIIVNEVISTGKQLPAHFVRFNGWPGFLKRPIVEAAICTSDKQEKIETVFSYFNKKTEWVLDEPGFISARVISMIINEAYFSLEEKVSSKKEIDIAMKLGTNYPFGPFEWSEKIGLDKIASLLKVLNNINERYKPSELLQKEAFQQ